MIARTGKGIHWMPGGHGVWNLHKHVMSDEMLIGAHWNTADPCFCIERRMQGMRRQSQHDKDTRMGYHRNMVDPEQVRLECEQHCHDKELF
jgi:hypothetical protein